MESDIPAGQRVVSGMRPTGRLHLGHYHGVIKNWVKLQHSQECFFFVADWHALTTHYSETDGLEDHVWEMVVDWLACGVSPGASTLFVQSQVPEHAELHLLLSMFTPLSWLERVPSYKEMQEQTDRDLATYGFLGYPLLQAADILMYKAQLVPVGEDQAAHVEFTREVARRFNHLYGQEEGFAKRAESLVDRLGRNEARLYREYRRRFQEQGDSQALEVAREMLRGQQSISLGDLQRLDGYLEGEWRMILPEPAEYLTTAPKVPGVDGRKMSKSYNNTLGLREEPDLIQKKLMGMMTDPARKRRSDPGDPEKCPVWDLHKIYSDPETLGWVEEGCRSAGIGCTDCKRRLLDAMVAELDPIRASAAEYLSDRAGVNALIHEGCEAARDVARDTLEDVSEAMGLDYA